MAFSAQQILDAFIERTADGCDEDDLAPGDRAASSLSPRAVTFGLRCARSSGYVRVWGPSSDPGRREDCHIIVERYNGAVALSAEIASCVEGAEIRPRSAHITEDEIGFSCGHSYGRFGHALRPTAIAKRYASAMHLVEALIDAFDKAGLRW